MVLYVGYHPQRRHCGGHGLYDQKSDIEKYAREHDAHIVDYHSESDAPRKGELPELLRALERAQKCNAALIVARLDRLAHDFPFLSAMVKAGIEFIACDTPPASRDSLPLLLAVVEQDARRISERTRAALARKPKRARRGTPANLTAQARRKGTLATKRNARSAYCALSTMIEKLRAEGRTLRGIADYLNAQGHKTRKGCRWNHNQVKRVLDRYGQGTED